MQKKIETLKVSIFFGGPSSERNISLDSARTFFDAIHTLLPQKNIFLVFFSKKLEPFLFDSRWIYCNTIEDFEDLLKSSDKKKLSETEKQLLSPKKLEKIIKKSDILVPLIHGTFGEDGELHKLFVKQKNFGWVGSHEKTLKLSLDKYQTQIKLQQMGFFTGKSILFKDKKETASRIIKKSLTALQIKKNEIVFVKPNDGGSSDGVSRVPLQDAKNAIALARKFSDQILIEKEIIGKEFSIIILSDANGETTPLFPSAIEIEKNEEDPLSFYTRKKKYMPGSGAYHQTPADFSPKVLEKIREEASVIFNALNFEDWARFDGFLCENDTIVWSELNAIPGMGMDSFLFQQCALANINTQQVCLLLLSNALKKTGKTLGKIEKKQEVFIKKISVIGGGDSSEKQVSRMSWHNVCEKISTLPQYEVHYVYLDEKKIFWQVPRELSLLHTVEEINKIIENRKKYEKNLAKVKQTLQDFALPSSIKKDKWIAIKKISLKSLRKSDYVFIALHGGMGEDGTLQKELEKWKIPHNGSDSKVSALCADKQKLNEYVGNLKWKHIKTSPNFPIDLEEIKKWLKEKDLTIPVFSTKENTSLHSFQKAIELFFDEKLSHYGFKWKEFVIKPAQDGCSTGVLVVKSHQTKKTKIKIISYYINALLWGKEHLPMHYLDPLCTDKEQMLLLPRNKEGKLKLMVEKFFNTSKKDFLELTITTLGKKGEIQALLPSETPSKRNALSLEEKFNKGVGLNLTPPRKLKKKEIDLIRENAALLANKLGIADYARIDFFYSIQKKILYLIEVNTLPGLTAATILFTQVLVTPSLQKKPTEFLCQIIEMKD